MVEGVLPFDAAAAECLGRMGQPIQFKIFSHFLTLTPVRS